MHADAATAVANTANQALDVVDAAGLDVPAGTGLQGALGRRIPAVAQFPVAAGMSFALASLGYSLVSELRNGELAAVSRTQESQQELALLVGWRL